MMTRSIHLLRESSVMPVPSTRVPTAACPICGYALMQTVKTTCPECGTQITADILLRAQTRTMRRRWLLAMIVVGIVMYAPHSWLLWMDYPWNEHRMHWLRLAPLLPGLPAALLLRLQTNIALPEWAEYSCMAICTIVMLVLFSWLASRSRRWFISTLLLLIPPAIYLGVLTHAIFRL